VNRLCDPVPTGSPDGGPSDRNPGSLVHRPGPVTARNKTRNVIRSAGGNALALEDEIEREAITLATWDGANILHLDMRAYANRIRLASEHGHLELFTRTLMKIQARQNLAEQIGASLSLLDHSRSSGLSDPAIPMTILAMLTHGALLSLALVLDVLM